MKVLYILPVSWGGALHHIVELANAISKYINTTVIKPKDVPEKLFSNNVETINVFEPLSFSWENVTECLSLKNVKSLFSFLKDISVIDEVKPDIVHFPEIYPHVSASIFLHKLHRKYPIIFSKHGVRVKFPLFYPARSFKSFFYNNILGTIYELAWKAINFDMIIVYNQEAKNALIQKNINAKKIAIIPHGAYTFFKKYEKNYTEREENCVLFFGIIREDKGIEYLIKAAQIVSKKIPDLKVIIAGKGDFSKYYKYIKDFSLFEIHNEYIPDEKVPELFKRAKFVVLPYDRPSTLVKGGQSGVINIAYVFKRPVIATNVGAHMEYVENGKTGFIIPPKNVKALADAMMKLLKDDELRKNMGKYAYKKAQTELSWNNIAKMHIKVYEEVLNERRKGN